jgi:hypothetical protein
MNRKNDLSIGSPAPSSWGELVVKSTINRDEVTAHSYSLDVTVRSDTLIGVTLN